MTTSIYNSQKPSYQPIETKFTKFLNRCFKHHGTKYDYSKVNYISAYSKVEIICPLHKSFWQEARKHSYGSGCQKCGREAVSKERIKKARNTFEERSNKIHNNKYDYSKVNYINNTTNVEIICPEHGSFWQQPNNHLQSKGCVYCSRERKGYGYHVSRTDPSANNIYNMYIMEITGNDESFFKIGITNNTTRRKYDITFESNKLYNVKYLRIIKDTKYNCFRLEQNILQKNIRKGRSYTPKIPFGGKTECYI